MLDPESAVPLYHQLKTALRSAIEAGVWAPDQAIPPERELIERYCVSRITVRQALADLVAEGLLYRRHGKGTFVADRRPGPITESLTELTGHLEELQLRGLPAEVEVLSLERRPMPPDVGQALQRSAGSEGWFLYRRVMLDGEPLMLSEVYLPADLNIPLGPETVKRVGMARLLEQHGYPPLRGAQRIAARRASPAEAGLLRVEPGEAALLVTRVIRGSGDLPLVWFRTLYRADRYAYDVELKRRR